MLYVDFTFRLKGPRIWCPSIKPAPRVFIQHLTRGRTSPRHDRSYAGIHLRSSANKRGGFPAFGSPSLLSKPHLLPSLSARVRPDQTRGQDAFSVWGFLTLPSAIAMISHDLCVI